MGSLAALFDESILIREARRWRRQQRWALLATACLACGALGLHLLLTLAAAADVDMTAAHQEFALLVGAAALSGSLLAYYQSMQVLRRELFTQTLDGLFLTLQKSRAVMLSVVAAGVLAGGVLELIFLPLVMVCAIALSMPFPAMLLALALTGASLLLFAAAGALWFFISQQLYTVNNSRARLALNTAGFLAFLAAAGSITGFWNSPDVVMGVCWTLLGWAVAGALVWSIRTILTEARAIRADRSSEWRSGSESGRLPGFIRSAAVGLPLVIIGSLAVLVPQAARIGIPFTTPLSNSLFLLPPVAVGDLLIEAPANPHGWAAWVCTYNLALLAAVLLLGLAMTASACQLYRRLREHPELAVGFSPAALQVIDVGRDDWSGFRNPILTRELRTRLRSGDARMFIVMATALSAAAGLVPLLSSLGGDIHPTLIADLARSSFLAVTVVQMAILWMIGPGIGAEVISAEREKKTFDMLLASRLTASQILSGRILGCMALLLLLISPSFPLLALAAFLHGVPVWMIPVVISLLVTLSFLLSVTCVSISALTRSSVTGKWTAYLLGMVILVPSVWLPFQLTNVSAAAYADLAVGEAMVLLAQFFLLVLPLWVTALLRLSGPRGTARRQPGDVITLGRVLRRMLPRKRGRLLPRLLAYGLMCILGVGGALKLAYHNMPLDTKPDSLSGAVGYVLRLAFSDEPRARAFRRDFGDAPAYLERERSRALQAGVMVDIDQLQAPLPPASANAAPDYVALAALLKNHPLGYYGNPVKLSIRGAQATPHASSPADADVLYDYYPGPVRSSFTFAQAIGMSEVIGNIGSERADLIQERAARELFARRRDVMDLVHQAADKPNCVFSRNWHQGSALLLPEYATMREAARILKAESYLMAREGHYSEAVANQARGLRLAQQAASDPTLIAHLVGVACDAIAVKGMTQILDLSGGDPAVARLVQNAVTTQRPRLQFQHAMVGELSLSAYEFERTQLNPIELVSLMNDFSSGSDSQVRAVRGFLRIPGMRALARRLAQGSEARLISEESRQVADAGASFPQRLRLFQADSFNTPACPDPIEIGTSIFLPVFGQAAAKEARAIAQENVLIAGAAVLQYRASHGSLPDQLEQAISPAPVDPFDGLPLHYVHKGSRFVVYSTGEKGTFDGGSLLSRAPGGTIQPGGQPSSRLESREDYFLFPPR